MRSPILPTGQPDQGLTVVARHLTLFAPVEIAFDSDPKGFEPRQRLLPLVPAFLVELALIDDHIAACPGTRGRGVSIASQQPTPDPTWLDMEIAEVVTDEVEALLAPSTINAAIDPHPLRYQVLRETVLADDHPKGGGTSLDRAGKRRLPRACRAIEDNDATGSSLRHPPRMPQAPATIGSEAGRTPEAGCRA
jgi:hypothetical protein